MRDYDLTFEWDYFKNRVNHEKHGVWFEEAKQIFNDPFLVKLRDDSHSMYEDRYLALGYTKENRLIIVAFSYPEHQEIIRIVSARKPTKTEREFYEKRI